ncbi:hypothetical protein ABIE61_000354 [Marinobacterium sp. MBR-111]
MEYHQTMWAEMSPDVYSGENCDQVRPRWNAHADGDMDSDYIEALTIDAKHFPPGTKIQILEPCCPKCGQIPELCRGDDGCDFNWDEWVLGKYS